MRRIITGIGMAGAVLCMAACGSQAPVGTPSPAASVAPAREALTRDSFSVVWGGSTASERQSVCDAYYTLGPAGAKRAMIPEGDDGNTLDWDLMISLVSSHC